MTCRRLFLSFPMAFLLPVVLGAWPAFVSVSSLLAADPLPVMRVAAVERDFEVTGEGKDAAWQKAAWSELRRRDAAHHDYTARAKMVYSAKGLYVLMEGTDRKLSASMAEDFMDLWTEDVFEFFLWPDESLPIYFEYEISPLGRELPILVPNANGDYLGWRPWHYEGERKVRKAVRIEGGEPRTGAAITGWRAEVFVPYALLKPLPNVPPRRGTRWRANLYRVDYDDGQMTEWDWARVGKSFHDFQNYGTLLFE